MTYSQLRQKIAQQLSKSTISQRPLRLAPIKRGTKAGELLKFAGIWQGNDLEECLLEVKETRSKAQF